MRNYWETVEHDDDSGHPLCVAHDTLDGAIEYANMHDVDMIYEIGGNWMEFGRCAICGEFVDVCELSLVGTHILRCEEICESCIARWYEHGF